MTSHPLPSEPDLAALDPFELLRQHAETRKKMTKAQLLADADMADEAYINMACEKDMAEAYYKDLEAELAALRAANLHSGIGEEGSEWRMEQRGLAEWLHDEFCHADDCEGWERVGSHGKRGWTEAAQRVAERVRAALAKDTTNG